MPLLVSVRVLLLWARRVGATRGHRAAWDGSGQVRERSGGKNKLAGLTLIHDSSGAHVDCARLREFPVARRAGPAVRLLLLLLLLLVLVLELELMLMLHGVSRRCLASAGVAHCLCVLLAVAIAAAAGRGGPAAVTERGPSLVGWSRGCLPWQLDWLDGVRRARGCCPDCAGTSLPR